MKMFLSWSKVLLVVLIAFPLLAIVHEPRSFVSAAEDELDGDGDTVDIEPDAGDEVLKTAVKEDEESDAPIIGKSPDAATKIYFATGVSELHSGQVRFLIRFENKGSQGFTLDTLDASFRCPMDYSFHIQNFSTISYNDVVEPKEDAILSYSFYCDKSFAGRPLRLTVNLAYRNMEGKAFIDAVCNKTITVVEIDDGLEGCKTCNDHNTTINNIISLISLIIILILLISIIHGP